MVIKAAGEARRMSYEEVGRAEGQAGLLQSILQSLEEAGFDSIDDAERARQLRAIVWMRVAQVLDRIAEEEKKRHSSGQLSRGTLE
jgi:hypothetical protein